MDDKSIKLNIIISNLKLYSEGLFAHRPKSVHCLFVVAHRMRLYDARIKIVVLSTLEFLERNLGQIEVICC
jgi:hypothetical protein